MERETKMERSIEAQGKTIEDAANAACAQLGVDRDMVSVEVLERPKAGFLGLGGTPARVKVSYSISGADSLSAFFDELFFKMNISVKANCTEQPNGSLLCDITGEGTGVVIGRRGETLDALQHIAGYVANKGGEQTVRVIVDSEGYRERREKSLTELAQKTAAKVVKYRRNMPLEPMSAYARHIVHAALEGNKEVTTFSVGSEPNRHVVIAIPGGDRRPPNGNGGFGGGRPRGGQRPQQGGYRGGNNRPKTEDK